MPHVAVGAILQKSTTPLANRVSAFDLRMRTEATDLIEDGGRVVGARVNTPDGELAIRADLVVGCDGRHSTLRQRPCLQVENLGAPMDGLWFRLSRKISDGDETVGHIEAGRIIVMLNRTDYWQSAYVIPKGVIEAVKGAGLTEFRATFAAMSPFVADRVHEIRSWDDVKLLDANRPRRHQSRDTGRRRGGEHLG